MATAIHARLHDQVPVHLQIVANAVTVHVILVRLPIVQPVVLMVIAIRAHLQDHLQIVANAVTVQGIHAQARIVHHVLTETAIPVHQVIVQPVVRTEIVTRVHRHAQVQIVAIAVTVHAIHVQVLVRLRIAESAVTVRAIHAQVQIVQLVVHTETAIHDQVLIVEIVVHLLIVHVAKTHTVAIAHAQAMIATPVRLRVTANAVAVQIVPEVASPMIAKNVHAVALAKSA
jgi:hypothetical protein